VLVELVLLPRLVKPLAHALAGPDDLISQVWRLCDGCVTVV
jgi:hypothetical protein